MLKNIREKSGCMGIYTVFSQELHNSDLGLVILKKLPKMNLKYSYSLVPTCVKLLDTRRGSFILKFR